LFGGLGPDEGVGAVVPAVDERADLGDQVQLDRLPGLGVEDVAVGPFDLFEEGQELLVAWRGFSAAVTCPVAMSRAANRVEVPCR
jgi:hypothetical protein